MKGLLFLINHHENAFRTSVVPKRKEKVLGYRCMKIDCHSHIGHLPTLEESINNLLNGNEKYGVAFSLLSNLDCAEYPEKSLSPLKVHLSQEEGLEVSLNLVKQYPDKLRCLAWCNPDNEICSEHFQEMILSNRDYCLGLKFHPWESQLAIDDEKYRPYLEFASRHNLPCLFHTAKDGFSNVAFLEKWLKEFPYVKFVAAHMELYSPNHGETSIELLKKYRNLYIDSAWVPVDRVTRVLREIGIDRIFFGTDSPIDGIDTLANDIYRSYEEELSEEEKRAFYFENGKKVYNLPID